MNIGWLILLGAMATISSRGDLLDTGHALPVGQPVSLASGEVSGSVVQVRFDETISFHGLELRLLEVNDSRCPTGVTCVWAGEARVTLQVSRAKDKDMEPVKLRLSVGARGQPAVSSAFGYVIELLSVDPYPENKVTPLRSNYVAEISISDAATTRLK